MKIKKFPIILTALFFVAMIFLTFSAKTFHNKMIPNVTVGRLKYERFEYETMLSDGVTKNTETKQSLAIPKKLYQQGEIYIIDHMEINGDTRTIAKSITLSIALENKDYYEVANDFFDVKQQFILHSNKEIHDGDEVHIINN